jgi:hypothetical protein
MGPVIYSLVLPRHNMNEQTEFGQNIAPLYSVIATGAELDPKNIPQGNFKTVSAYLQRNKVETLTESALQINALCVHLLPDDIMLMRLQYILIIFRKNTALKINRKG